MMAFQEGDKKKSFTFIWKLENASYCLSEEFGILGSPTFIVNEISKTKWKLEIDVSETYCNGHLEFYLQRQDESEGAESVEIDCEFALLSSDGKILHSYFEKNSVVEGDGYIEFRDLIRQKEVFFEKRSVFLPQDVLTARCRIWKSIGDMSKDVQCFARTCVAVEKISFLWNIVDFSLFDLRDVKSHEIKSLNNGKVLMTLKLNVDGGFICKELIRISISTNFDNVKVATFKLSIVDAFKNALECFQDEFWYHLDSHKNKDYVLFYTKRDLLENKSVYLPNDVLSLQCECVFSRGEKLEEIEMYDSECSAVVKKKPDNNSLDEDNKFSVHSSDFINNFKSMLKDSSLSDVKLRTKSRSHAAHKSILGAQSPVFKAMFSNEMKEKIKECVDIEDLNDDTLLQMLHYIYSGEVEELDWARAIQLYEAADKYQILNLRDVCSSYLKSNLRVTNACEALVVADLHQDEDLKSFVQDFIMRFGNEVINSEEWEQLAATNLKLAYDTMRLKFKE